MNMTRTVVNVVFVIVALGLVILGALAGVAYQALKVTGAPQEYTSVAKLSIGNDATPDRIAAAISDLKSDALHRHAHDRVRALHEDIEDAEFSIQAKPDRVANAISIECSGPHPKFTRWHLDAVLDKYVAARQSAAPASGAPGAIILERASGALESLQDWRMPIITAGSVGGLCGLLLAFLFRVPCVALAGRSAPQSEISPE